MPKLIVDRRRSTTTSARIRLRSARGEAGRRVVTSARIRPPSSRSRSRSARCGSPSLVARHSPGTSARTRPPASRSRSPSRGARDDEDRAPRREHQPESNRRRVEADHQAPSHGTMRIAPSLVGNISPNQTTVESKPVTERRPRRHAVRRPRSSPNENTSANQSPSNRRSIRGWHSPDRSAVSCSMTDV